MREMLLLEVLDEKFINKPSFKTSIALEKQEILIYS